MQTIEKMEYEEFKYIIGNNEYKSKNIICEDSQEYIFEENYINNIHDKIFKDLLNNKDEMIYFLGKYLNLKLEKENIEKYNPTYITRKYISKQSDVVYKKKDENIFFLVEHQSTIDNNMLIRLMEYGLELIRGATEYNAKKFPKVIPIVLYTGEKKWYLKNEYMKSELKTEDKRVNKLGLNVKYNLIDINRLKINDLINDGTLISKAIIIEKCKSEDNVKRYLRTIIRNTKQSQKEQMERILRYALKQLTNEENVEKYIKELYNKEDKSMNLLTANLLKEKQKLIQRGEKLGEKRGEKRGEMIGIKKVAKAMKEKGMEITLISAVTGLKVEEI